MKRIFKHIVRKVDEKVANSINSVNECINTVSEKMNNKEDISNLIILTSTVGVGLIYFSLAMYVKMKTM